MGSALLVEGVLFFNWDVEQKSTWAGHFHEISAYRFVVRVCKGCITKWCLSFPVLFLREV
jgi:hypothetical protein